MNKLFRQQDFNMKMDIIIILDNQVMV